MQIARSKAGVFTKGNKLFVIKGNGSNCHFLETCEVYDSISNNFTFIECSSYTLWSGNIYCFSFNRDSIIVIMDEFYYFYNIITNSWSKSYNHKFEKLDNCACVDLGKLIQ